MLERDELIRMAFDVAGVGTCVWDLATGRIEWDERRLGMTGAECGPRDLEDFLKTVHPEDRQRVREAVEAALATRGTYSMEYRMLRPDGGVAWIASRGKVLGGNGGGTFITVAWDVTARRTAEAALRESERRFRELADAVPEIVWTNGPTLTEIDQRKFNHRFYEFTGFEAANVPAYPWDTLLHPDDLEAARVASAARMVDPRPYELENRWRRSDGVYRWFLSRAVPVWDAAGRLAGWVACATDIHDRKLAEEELRSSRATLELALDIAGVGRWMWDVVKREHHWDARTRAIFGMGEWEVITKPIFLSMVHPDDRATVDSAGLEIVDGITPGCATEYRIFRRSDGAMRWVSSRGRALRDERTGKTVRIDGVISDITERKRAEQTLRDNQETLELALDIADLGTWQWDVATDVSIWSPRCRSIFGLGMDEPVQRDTFEKLVHPEDRARAIGRREETIAGKDYAAEFRVIRADGEVRWVASRGRTTVDPATGRAVRVTGVVSDITEHKQAEEALLESERHYRELAEAMPHVVWTADAAGNLDYVNERGAELTGKPTETLAGWNWTDLLHTDDLERTRLAWTKAVASGAATYQIEHRMRAANGEYRWFLARAVSVRDERGRVVRWFGTHTDIDQQKRAAEDRKFLDDLNELLLRPETGTVLGSCASAFARHLGVDNAGFAEVDEATGTVTIIGPNAEQQRLSLSEMPPESMEAVRSRRPRVLHDVTRDAPPRQAAYYASQGVGALMTLPLLRDWGPVCTCYVASAKPRRWRQEEADLLRVVAERAWSAHERARLTDAERAARKAAEEASRAKDQFLAVLSHELRTPLNPVLASVSAMEKQKDIGESLRAELAMVRRNVELEARLIDDLLDLTRIGRGKLDLRRQVVDLHALVRHVVQICSPESEAKRMQVSVRLEATRHHVNGDPARLQQVLWNLLKNAIKFTPARGCVGVQTRDAGESDTSVVVTDSGIGIAVDALPKIFDAFEQASPEINRRFGGLGLGLAISKGLVDAHGGTLTATSGGPGAGSTFTLTLAAVSASAATAHQVPPIPATTGAQTVDLNGHAALEPRGLRILLVEDHADTARVMSRLLRQLGHRVTAVESVGEARAAIAGEEFDLLLSDLGLPDASGHELMKTVRELRPGLPGVAISGYGTDDDIQKSAESGFADHITKPINIQTLEDVLRRYAVART